MFGKKALLILPNKDFDVTETAVPWRVLTEAGVQVDIATEDGKEGECDPRLLTGVIFGQLGAGIVTIQDLESNWKQKSFVKFLFYFFKRPHTTSVLLRNDLHSRIQEAEKVSRVGLHEL